MASVQERLQIIRTPLDKWSTREQLCLASSVSSSGDGCSGNWMSVSRTLKLLCGNSKDALQARPTDWFSQKNCAVQYGNLLEDVETPKRKKRSSESSTSSSPAPEPPPEAVLRRLTEERMQEIKLELKREQEEYAKIFAEIKVIQSGNAGDDQLLQMWADIEKEQEMLRIEEMRMENQMREREFRKQELQRTWRTGGTVPSNSSSSSSLKSSTDTTAVDMDVEDIIGSSVKPATNSGNATQVVPAGTSPLLSSLLKSPTAGTPATSMSTSSARANAPTITTLLTGGSIPNSNMPAIIPSRDDAIQMLARPLSGPPSDTVTSTGSVQLSLLSPSQSAPTLSMLLEKNKSSSLIATESKIDDCGILKNAETQVANDSNNESIPMDIEEDLPPTNVEQHTDLQSGDIDDTDANEEQQLLEVFKNIGNIEELDIDVSAVIDEEVDFLKGVDEDEAPIEENEVFEDNLEPNMTPGVEGIINQQDYSIAENDIKKGENYISAQSQDGSNEAKTETKIDMISSDDSNDNIPLAAVASLESSKDRLNESSNESNFLKEPVESAFPKNEPGPVDLENESTTVKIKQEMLDEFEADNIDKESADVIKKCNSLEDKATEVFIIPSIDGGKTCNAINMESEESQNADEDSKEQGDVKHGNESVEMNVETTQLPEQDENNEIQSTIKPEIFLQGETNADSSSLSMLQPPPAISIADTDENSSSTDISKDDKLTKGHLQHQRKSPHDARTDDEMPNPSTQMAVPSSSGNLTPRPTALRKLRDRDRSESPMIDDDATTHSDHSTTTTNQRSRRRYSSTPVIDSIPNSPASSDRDESRDVRTTKKSFLITIYNVLQTSKYAPTLQRILTDETSVDKLEEVCLKQIDFVGIKKNIESGSIRTVYDLQRDVFLMCQNALMITKTNSACSKNVLAFQQECQSIREFMPNRCDPQTKFERDTRDTKSGGSTSSSTGGCSTSKGRSGSRKSLRLS